MEKADISSAKRVLTFLTFHRLSPTPQNYTLAYIALNEPSSRIAQAVKAIADDGIRIRQAEADEIVALYAGDSIRHASSLGDNERRRLHHQATRLGELTASAVAESEEFNRNLNKNVRALDSQAARTVQIVARMIERSKQAEDSFRSAMREIETLKQDLASAREEAERDGLTGLPNRRQADRHLQEVATRGRARTIGICDVDFFKSVNDRFGHTVGDRVLKMVATSLAASCSPHLVARWGGEEFILIIEGDKAQECVTLLDRAREELGSRRFRLRETDDPLSQITFSAGVAVAHGDHSSTPAALHRADAALYSAKLAGRNQVKAA